jgi:hypothetical protein
MSDCMEKTMDLDVHRLVGIHQEKTMNRRDFIQTAVAGGVAAGLPRSSSPAEQSIRKYLALNWYRTRRDLDDRRLSDFLGDNLLPALNRAGIRPVGLLQVSVGPDNPSFLLIAPFPTMAAIQETMTKLASDEKWTKDLAAFDEKWDLAYERRESWLLQTFKSFPDVAIPKVESGKTNLFELRMYESRNTLGHVKKVSMFDGGEIEIFKRVGVNPVFFGSTLFGSRMPNLVYMISFPSMEARTEAWSRFGQDPEWKKISTAPGMSGRELVSSISNQLLTSLPASQLK